jgi:hypothetical protein
MSKQDDAPPEGTEDSRIGVGVGMGVAIGLAIGVAMDQSRKDKGE